MDKKRLLIILFSIIYFIDFTGLFLVLPIFSPIFLNPTGILLPFYASQFIRTFVVGSLVATYGVAQFIAGPIIGELSDQYGRKKLLMCGLYIGLAGYIVCALSFTFNMLFLLYIGRILVGIASANAAILNAATSDISTEKDRAINLGYITGAAILGMAIGPLIGGILSEKSIAPWFGLSTPFWVIGFVFVCLILLMRIYEDTGEYKKREFHPLKGFVNIIDCFKQKNLSAVLLFTFFFVLSTESLFVAFPIFAVKKFATTQTQLGHIISIGGVMAALSATLINKRLSKRYSSEKIFKVALILLFITYFIFFAPSFEWGLYIPYALFGLTSLLVWNHSINMCASIATDETRGKVLGVTHSLLSLSIIIGPLIIGSLSYAHYNIAILICALFAIISFGIFSLSQYLKKAR